MQNETKKKSLIAASVAGILTLSAVVMAPIQALAEDDAGEACYGVNACKGTGDCGGKGYSCAGQNSCKGTGFIKLPKGTCTRISGGSLTPVEATV